MKREERASNPKRIIVLLIVFTMIFTELIPFFDSFKAFATDGSDLTTYVKEELPKQVKAEISVEPTADTGKPFKMNVRLKMPRILTYKYQENFPASKMYDEYKNVKVVIPLPQGVKTVDPSYMQDGNIVIEFPKATDYDFEGETDKSIDIMLMTTDNGSVANGTKFVFSGAKWMCELDVYNEYKGTTGGQTTATDAEGAINEVTHTATAGDTWGLMKTHVKTVETDEHVVFYFNVDVGLEGTDDSGNKMLYSTATEEYNRYGRLNFDNYNVTDQIPELIQVNQDGSSQKTGIYPEEVKITKEAVSGYGIDSQVVYDSQNGRYEQGTTRSVEFDEYNEYDPNSQTDIIGISPQFTRYEVQLAYDKDAFLIDSNEKIISTFKIENTAQVDYKLLGEAATSDHDSAQASYVIRRGTGQIVLSKYLVYPKDGETVREAYDAELSKTYPIEGQLKFKLYKDKDCTEPAVCIDGTAAEAVYDVNRGNAVFDYMESGTYYIKEIGGVRGFGPSEESVAVTIPRSGGIGRITFDNENDTFGAAMFYKVKNVNEQQQPFEGVSFRIFKTKPEAEQNQASSAFMTVTTDRNGTAYVNDIPNGTYYVREVTPLNYDINEEIYTLNINNNIVVGLTDESGKVCGTEENPIVNESNVGTLYLGVIKWDVELKDEKEINYIMPSNQITPVASAYSGYKMDVYYENEDGEIVPYMENGRQLTLTTDKNGIVKKELPEGHYYVVASGYDSDKYTPWAQNNQTSGSTYFMGDFYVTKGDDNYNLPQPDKDGNINWNAGGAVDYKKEYNVIHNFSGVANMSLKKLGSSSYVVPEARFDVYKLDKKGGALTNKIYSNVQTNNKAYRFFSDVEPGWYAFVETATGPRYYLPEDINERRQDIEIVAPQFDQSLKGAASIEKHKAEMILRSKLVFFNNTLIDYTPLVGCTFEKVDAVTKEKLELGAKFIVYYYENNDPSGNRVYLSGFYYNTNTRKNVNYDQSQYETVFPNGFPLSKTYLTQGTAGTEFVPSFEDDTTTMVGWIPRSLVGKDIDLYVEEIVPPIGYKLPDDRADRIKKVTVKGGYVDEDNIITIENQPKEPSVSITVAVSNRNQSQSSDLISSSDRGTYVEGSTVRLYEWNEDDNKWEFVAEKNTKIDGTYPSESGAVFQTEYGKTYAIAEKKENNKGGLLFYDVAHKWIRSQSNDQLKSGNGFDYGTYKLEEQLTTDGWTLYGPITMPDSTTKAENYKFTFYNIPLQQMWLKKTDKYGDVIRGNGTFKIYMVPDGASPYDDVSKLKYITSYRSNRGWETYKGARLKPGQYVILEERAPSGYSKVPGQDRKVFYISGSISYIPGNTNVIGQLVTMYNIEKDYYLGFANNNMNKTVLSPTGTVKNSLLGHVGESIPVKYSISNLALSAPSQGGLVYENAVLEDSGLSYYAGINGNGDEIQLEKDDYAFTSIDVAKAVGRQGGFVKAQVQYKSAEDGSWKSAGTYTFSAHNTRVNLGSDNDKATAFRLIYDDASVKNGFTGGNITVNAVLYKRDIFKYDKEIISVKNTSSYEFDYSIYNETGSLEKHHSRSIKDALFNLDPTTIYPKAKIQKSAAVEGDKSIVQAGDKITYTLTLTNTGGENPIVNPVIIDQLPSEIRLMPTGKDAKYYNITMPSGITLDSASDVIENDGKDYVALTFKGGLEEGQAITVTFDALVKREMTSVDDMISNNAAASSSKEGYAIGDNLSGASFKNDNDQWPESNSTYDAVLEKIDRKAYGYVADKADNVIEKSSGATIRKFVMGEMDKNIGYQDYISYTEAGGMVNFKIIFQNNSNSTLENIRLADLFPQPGDSVSREERESMWKPTPGSYTVYKYDKNERRTVLNPQEYTYTGAFNENLRGDSVSFGGSWSNADFSSDTTALGLDFGDVSLEKGEYIEVELKMTAPSSGEFSNTFASNNASVYYDEAGGTVNNQLISNTVHSIYIKNAVGVGGLVFLDKNMDGIRDDNERLIPEIPVKLYVYENGKLKDVLVTETGDDGRYYFDDLIPAFVKDEAFDGKYYYQYQIEFDIPDGARLTSQYSGGADSWKNNELNKPGDIPAPRTVNDSAYTDNQRSYDSNPDVRTYKTEIFYLNDCPDPDAPIRTPEAGYDLTYDAGLVRVKEIEIHKYEGEDITNPLQGAEFKITGSGLPAEGIVKTSGSDGSVVFDSLMQQDGNDFRINYYGNYKVEEIKAPDGYVNQGWFETIIAGTDEENLTYESLDEVTHLDYFVGNPKQTQLTIEKSVTYGTADDLERDFKFQVILDGNTFAGTYKVIDSEGAETEKNTKDSDGYILIGHGDKAVIENINSGTIYSVREVSEESFTVSSEGNAGVLSVDADENVASFVNEKEKGYVRIEKEYRGNSLFKNDIFTFNVSVEGEPYDGFYYVDGVAKETHDGKITIRGGETALIHGGLGQTFEVTEEQMVRYLTTVSASENINVDNDSRKASGEFAQTTGEISFTNELQTEGLVVSKEVAGINPDIPHENHFTFRLTVDGKPYMGNYLYYPTGDITGSSVSRYTPDGTFMLTASSKAYFDGLPKGTEYKVEEIPNENDKYDYAITSQNAEGVVGTSSEAVFTNTMEKTRELQIHKKVVGTTTNQTFGFNLYVDNILVTNLSYRVYNSDGTYTSKTTTNGTIEVGHNQYATISKLPVGADYEVIEIRDNNYHVVIPENYKGTITEGSSPLKVEYINATESNEGYFTINKEVDSYDYADYNRDYYIGVTNHSPVRYDHVQTQPSSEVGRDNMYIKNLLTNQVSQVTANKYSTAKSGENIYSIVKIKPYEQLLIKLDDLVTYKGSTLPYVVELRAGEWNIPSGMTTNTRVGTNILGQTMGANKNAVLDRAHGKSYTVTNTRSQSEYDFAIQKRFNGNGFGDDINRSFKLFIEEYDVDKSAWVPYSGSLTSSVTSIGTFNTTNGYVEIAPDEKLTIRDVPTGTKFRVTEIDEKGLYTATYSGFNNNSTREVTINANKTVTVENRVNGGQLEISKTNIGGDPNDVFDFSVNINGTLYNGEYKLISGGTTTTKSMTNGKLQLKGGERAVIEGIDPDLPYVVEELASDDYVSDERFREGVIVKGQTSEVSFTNTVKRIGLTIMKNAIGGDSEDTFEFDVLVKMPGSSQFTPYSGSYLLYEADGVETGEDVMITDGVVRLKGNQAATLKDIPVGTEYTITEKENDKYTQTKAEGANGIIIETGNFASFENTRNTNSLSFEKQQVGGSSSDEFTFNVLINGMPYSGSYNILTGEQGTKGQTADGVIKLTGGQRAVIEGIPTGYDYQITEEDRMDYDEQVSITAGIIETGENHEVFTNVKLYSDLMFSKVNIGGAANDQFNFVLNVDGQPYNGTYTLIQGEIEEERTATDGNIVLKGDQKAKVPLPVGSQYEITEADTAGYTKSIPYVSTFSPEYEDLPEVTTGEGTASGTVIDGLQSLEFTNVFSQDASLEISKVRDGGSVNDVFTFNVMIDGNPFAGQYTVFNEEGNKEGIYSTDDGKVQIKGGGRIYITGLEVDAAYEISEDPARNYIGSEPVSGTLKEGTPAEGHMAPNVAMFTNQYVDGSFAVGKTNEYGNPSDVFTFTAEIWDEASSSYIPLSNANYTIYQLSDGNVWEPVYDDAQNDIFATSGDGTFTLTGGQKAVFEDIDVESSIKITENAAEEYDTYVKIGEGDYSEGLSIEFITQQDLLQVDFRNVYKPYPIDVVLEAEKILRQGTLEADQFDFILESEEGRFESLTAKNDGNGNISFAPLSFDEDTVGVHEFVISEVKGNDPKITYSDEKIYVQVDIQKDDEGYLHSQVQYSRDKGQWQQEKMSITNVQVKPTEETLQVKKSITGRDFKDGDSFTFVLKDENDQKVDSITITPSNGSDVTGSFDGLVFDEKGTFEYTVSEEKGRDYSFDYDNKVYTVQFTVDDDGRGQLKADKSITYGQDETPTNEIAFTNAYTAPDGTQAVFELNKDYTGAELKADDFEFVLKDSNGVPLETVKNEADGSITFSPIEYKEDVGVEGATYTYTISEVIGTNPSITYDRNDIIVNVNVTKNIDNDLVAQVVYKKEGQDVTANPTFVNTYTAPKPAKANFTVTKEYNDSEGEARAIEANQFRFMLTGQNGAPMPDDVLTGNTKTVNSSGSQTGVESISFGNITYDSEGEYRYTIEEIAGIDPSITYDKGIISVIVKVTKNDDNVLVAETEYIDETFTTDPTFNNVYTKPDPTKAKLEISKQYRDKEGNGEVFGENVFSFEIEAEENAPLPRHTVVQTADSTKSFEKMYFEEIEYTEDVGLSGKTYSYIIKEKIPVKGVDAIWNPSVTYSKSKIKAEVTIIKDINNDLQVDKIEYFKEDGTKIDANPTIENIYNKPEPTTAELLVDKSFVTAEGEAFDFGDNIFNFTLEPQDGAPAPDKLSISTTLSDASEEKNMSFGEIEFTEDPGLTAGSSKDYVYIIRETAGDNPSVTYDDTVITATVTVTKDADNKLSASVAYTVNGKPIDEASYENIYTLPEPTTAELLVDKSFVTAEGEAFNFGENIFSFTVEPQNNAPEPEKLSISTKLSDAAEEKDMSFGLIEFTEDPGITAGSSKDYVYLIRETAGDNPSVTYDDTVITATVTVTKDADNKLSASVAYSVNGKPIDEASYENIYTLPEPTTAELFVDKSFVTAEGEAFNFGDNIFNFTLEPQDGAPAPEKLEIETTGSDVSTEELSFGKIKFTEDVGLTAGSSKDYVYKITEIEGDNPSVTYDSKTVTATVRVTKDDDNKLNAKVTYTVDGDEVEKAEFDNVYTLPEPVDTELLVSKWLRDAAENEINFGDSIFEFEIEPQGEAPAPENLTVATDATDAALQELSFGRIHFDKDVGLTAGAEQVYTYIIREIAGDNPSVTYNTAEVTAEITVTKTDENKLAIASIEYFDEEGALIAEGEGQSAVVENLYTAPEPSEIVFELKKIYEGHELAGGDFEFELVDEDGNVLQTVTNDATGHVAFAPVIFDEDPGKATLSYGFTIREKNLENPSITYDGEEISIVVEISKTGDNVLESVVTYTKSAEDVTLEPYFRNSYTAPEPVEAVIQLHKTYMNGELYGNDFRFMLMNDEGVALQTVANDENGNIVFAPLIFDEDVEGKDGVNVYTFTVREINEGEKYVTYDERLITVQITVSKDAENRLMAAVCYFDEDGAPLATPEFVNEFTPPVKTGDTMANSMLLYMLLALGAGASGLAARRRCREE